MQQQEHTGQHTKKQHGFSRSNKPATSPGQHWLADQTGDGENFMRRYLQMRCLAFLTVSKNVRWVQKMGSKFKAKAGRGVRPAFIFNPAVSDRRALTSRRFHSAT